MGPILSIFLAYVFVVRRYFINDASHDCSKTREIVYVISNARMEFASVHNQTFTVQLPAVLVEVCEREDDKCNEVIVSFCQCKHINCFSVEM